MISPWLDDATDHAAALRGDIEVDVAVIGAGFTGLCSAIELQREGMNVAVIESQHAGFGASGRNAGHLTPTIGKDLPTLTRMFGPERVRAMVQLADRAIRYVESMIEIHHLDCHYEPVGNVVAAVHPTQHKNLDRAAKTAAQYGVPGEILEPDEMRRRGLPARFTRGYYEPHGGILHPGRYVRGLRQVALNTGVQLFEQTPVTRFTPTASPMIHTAHGRVHAAHVVLATNAYTPQLGALQTTVVPMHVQLFRTAPLTSAQKAAVDWHGREGIYTAHEMLESYRLTHDDRIVGGAKWVRYGFRGRTLSDWDPTHAAGLERTFRARFPELGDVQVTEHWGGPIAFALDFLPVVGRLAEQANVLYSVGYAGHGVALASYAGRMIADLLLERHGPGAALWSRRRIPLPPEPFRWLTVHLLTSIFGFIDRRVDRKIEHR